MKKRTKNGNAVNKSNKAMECLMKPEEGVMYACSFKAERFHNRSVKSQNFFTQKYMRNEKSI